MPDHTCMYITTGAAVSDVDQTYPLLIIIYFTFGYDWGASKVILSPDAYINCTLQYLTIGE